MSIFDLIAKPIQSVSQKVTDIISKPISDSSTLGIVKNTIAGLPAAAGKVGTEVAQGILRSAASTGLTLTGQKEISAPPESDVPATTVYNALYGGKPVKNIQERSNEAAKSLETFGFSKPTSKVLGGLGVVGSTALDLFPGTEGDSAAVKTLVKEGSEQGVINFLSKNFKNFR